jgi:hypothetical protein
MSRQKRDIVISRPELQIAVAKISTDNELLRSQCNCNVILDGDVVILHHETDLIEL